MITNAHLFGHLPCALDEPFRAVIKPDACDDDAPKQHPNRPTCIFLLVQIFRQCLVGFVRKTASEVEHDQQPDASREQHSSFPGFQAAIACKKPKQQRCRHQYRPVGAHQGSIDPHGVNQGRHTQDQGQVGNVGADDIAHSNARVPLQSSPHRCNDLRS